MNALSWLNDSFSLRLALTLAHFLWQGAAITALVVMVGWLLKRATAHVRYSTNVAALAMMVVCLPVTFAMVDTAGWSSRPAADDANEPAYEERTPAALPPNEPANEPAIVARARRVPAAALDDTDASAGGAGSKPAVLDGSASHGQSRNTSGPNPHDPSSKEAQTIRMPAWIARVTPYFSVMCFAAVPLMLWRLVRSMWGGQQLRRAATPLEDEDLLSTIADQARRIGLRAAPAVAYCERTLELVMK